MSVVSVKCEGLAGTEIQRQVWEVDTGDHTLRESVQAKLKTQSALKSHYLGTGLGCISMWTTARRTQALAYQK